MRSRGLPRCRVRRARSARRIPRPSGWRCGALARPSTTARASGCSLGSSSADASAKARDSSKPPNVYTPINAGLPSVSVPVLSTTSVSTSRSASIAAASRNSTPARAPRPLATMIEIGVARPSAHGQAMIRADTAAIRACASFGSGPNTAQATNASTATATTAGTNHAATWSAMRCSGALERCACATSATICASRVSVPTFSARMVKRAVLVDGGAGQFGASGFFDRHRLATEHGFVDMTRAFEHDAIGRHFLTGAHAQACRRHARRPAARRVRCHRHRCGARSLAPDRCRARKAAPVCRRARSSRKSPSSTRVTITAADSKYTPDVAVHIAKCERKHAGRDERNRAVQPGHARAERDQRVHVRRPGFERAPAAREKRRSAPEHDDRREHRLDPRRDAIPRCRQVPAEQVRAHRQRDDRHASARMRSRSAATVRAIRHRPRHPRSAATAPAPCRTSGNDPGRFAALPGASGRCRSCRPAAARLRQQPLPRYRAGSARNFSRQRAEQK